MLCNSCEKLALLPSIKQCMRCKGNISKNLQIICDNCSDSEKLCSVCLKKKAPAIETKKGCQSCGKK